MERSDLIVFAEVSGVSPLDDDEDSFAPSAEADLLVVETWKGPEREQVAVPFMANLICPAPPVYAEGKKVLAFLVTREGEWRTVGLSYGTHTPKG